MIPPDVQRSSAGEVEFDVGLATRHNVREPARRAARHRPAERAVAGVEVQVAIARLADQRRIRRRCRAQSGPVTNAVAIAGVGKQFERPRRQRFTARRIQ